MNLHELVDKSNGNNKHTYELESLHRVIAISFLIRLHP